MLVRCLIFQIILASSIRRFYPNSASSALSLTPRNPPPLSPTHWLHFSSIIGSLDKLVTPARPEMGNCNKKKIQLPNTLPIIYLLSNRHKAIRLKKKLCEVLFQLLFFLFLLLFLNIFFCCFIFVFKKK